MITEEELETILIIREENEYERTSIKRRNNNVRK
jgi:hypothetical protein